MSLLNPILKNALWRPFRVAVKDDQREYRYMDLVFGAYYIARTIRRTTQAGHIGFMLPTSGAVPTTLLGIWLANRVAVPLNFLLSKDELDYVIRDSDIDTLITSRKLMEHIGGQELVPDHIRVIHIEDIAFSGIPPLKLPPRFHNDDLAVILYTSGTSGRPKGVMLTHGNLASNVDAGIAHARITRANLFLGVLPQFHSFGLTVLTLIPLRICARVVYTARFIPRQIIRLLRQHRPDFFIAVPSMYGAILSVKDASPDDFNSIIFPISGGEPLPQSVYDAYRERFNIRLLEGYGLTETSPATNWCTPHEHKPHSVGKPLPGVRNIIVDENNHAVEPGTEGEIIIAGPNVMKGYYKQPELTDKVIMKIVPTGESKPVRAFRTGDIGHIDTDGFLYITGRKKEMLIIGGENVFPREIEEVLNQHPQIRDSAVVGKSDGMRGEVPVAFVELNEEGSFDENAVRSFCRDRLAQYKVPREIHVLDKLARNPTGKILRRQLKEEFLKE